VSQLSAAKALLEREAKPEDTVKTHPFKRVLNDHLIVQIDTFKYTGRIIVPETAKRKPTKGVVIAVAANVTDIAVGDKILYSQFAGYLLKFGDMPMFRCIGYSEVLAILNDDAPEIEAEGA
jgi:co-chaperonin GroES (HSP10)